MDKSASKVFNYYYDVAFYMGFKGKAEDVAGGSWPSRKALAKRQSSFSVSDFYQTVKGEMNEEDFAKQHMLFAAFLGDAKAQERFQEEMAHPSRTYDDDELAPFFSREAPLGSDPDQLEVVKRSLSQPFTIVQGPPGTGKTKTIVNVVSCIQGLLQGQDGAAPTVAIVSSNREAVKHALQGIWDLVRCCDVEGEHALAESCIRLGNKNRREKFVDECRADLDAQQFEELGLNDVGEALSLPGRILGRFPVFGCTLHSLHKCFAKDVDAFDYVIVDEGSQVPNYLGLIALRYARRMVLLGDVKQIPPIVAHWRIDGVECDGVDDMYREGDDNSFIRACENVFGLPIGGDGNIMLRRHYRCEPGIIGFCSQYVYADGAQDLALVPMKRDGDGVFVPAGEPDRVPIRVVWYDGVYRERLGDYTGEESGSDRRPKVHNLRQVLAFMEDELPRVRKQLEEGKSVCVLSPYRAPIETLGKMLDGKVPESEEKPIVERTRNEADSKELFQLTIHRAQGKGYDVIYYLSVDDYDTWSVPWSQQRCLVNVAVSRAREEFCLITSSVWFAPQTAKRLGSQRPNGGWKHEKSRHYRDYYLKKLLRYVEDNHQKTMGDCGFHRASGSSIFDAIPLKRAACDAAKAPEECIEEVERESAGHECMRDALCRVVRGSGYRFKEERKVLGIVEAVAGKAGLKKLDKELRAFLKSDTKFDFVIFKGKLPVMAIEVDGEYHREYAPSINADRKKNRVVKDAMCGATYGIREVDGRFSGYLGDMHWEGLDKKAKFALVRIPTNGETFDEEELIARLLREFENR